MPELKVFKNENQESLSTQLLNDLRAVLDKPEYGPLYYTTTIGCIETVKLEQFKRFMEG